MKKSTKFLIGFFIWISVTALISQFLKNAGQDSTIAIFFTTGFLCLYFDETVQLGYNHPFLSKILRIIIHTLGIFNLFIFTMLLDISVGIILVLFLVLLGIYCFSLYFIRHTDTIGISARNLFRKRKENKDIFDTLTGKHFVQGIQKDSLPVTDRTYFPEPEFEPAPPEINFQQEYATFTPDEIYSASPYEYEEIVAEYLRSVGYIDVDTTPQSGDFGADVIASTLTGKKLCVQCKQYSAQNPVGVKAVQEVYAAKDYYKCDFAFIFTTSYYSNQAIDMARQLKVKLYVYEGDDPVEIK